MKIFKWILGLFAAIGGILAIMLVPGGSKRKKVKELKSKMKDVDDSIKSKQNSRKAIEKTLDNKKKAIEEMKRQGVYKPKDVSVDDASNFLKKYAKKKKKK